MSLINTLRIGSDQVRTIGYVDVHLISWWRHQMETFSALLALCSGNSSITGEFPSKRPVTRSFDVFFDLCLNKRLSKQSWGWWFETQPRSLWRHCDVTTRSYSLFTFRTLTLCKRMWKTNRWFTGVDIDITCEAAGAWNQTTTAINVADITKLLHMLPHVALIIAI